MTDTDAVVAPKRGRPGISRQVVLDAAVAAFIEHGYDATSMGLLSSRLGLSKAAIYHHFPAKVELLRAALDEALGGLEGVLREDGATRGTAEERLAFVMSGAVHVLVDRLSYVTLLLRVRGNTDIEREAVLRRRDFDARVTKVVVQAQAEGDIRADIDPAIAARLLFGMVNSLTEWLKPGKNHDEAELADAVAAIVFDGLRVHRP
jgi:AcrR family transcriptional regulator